MAVDTLKIMFNRIVQVRTCLNFFKGYSASTEIIVIASNSRFKTRGNFGSSPKIVCCVTIPSCGENRMNVGRNRESSLSALCKPQGENVARWTIAREIGERKKGRNEISSVLKKDDTDARPKKFSRPKESGRSRKRTGRFASDYASFGDVVMRVREIQSEHTTEIEVAIVGWKEKRPFLRIPKAKRRDATTRLWPSFQATPAARREKCRERKRPYITGREERRDWTREGEWDWRESSTPPPQTTSPLPLLVSPRSASPRLASPTVNHLRSPCQKSASHARRFATRITRLASGKRIIKGPDDPAEGSKRTPMNWSRIIAATDQGICPRF